MRTVGQLLWAMVVAQVAQVVQVISARVLLMSTTNTDTIITARNTICCWALTVGPIETAMGRLTKGS
jgi:hypothetical protein